MRILQINTVCGTGSTGRIVVDIHKSLCEKGHESIIAYGRGKCYNTKNIIKIGNTLDFYIHAVKTRLFDLHGFGSRRVTESFLKKIVEINPDIIHLHNMHGYYLDIEILFRFLKSYKKPIVWTLHDCWPFTGHCAHFDYADCKKWQTHCQNCPEKRSYPKSVCFDNSYRNFEKKRTLLSNIDNLTLVTPSIWLSSLLKISFLRDYPIRVINNGIDLDIFKPRESNFRERYNLNKHFLILGVASVWNRRKGFDTFLKLSKLLSEDEKIVLVGLTKQQKKSLPVNILGIEKTNNAEQLAEIYTASDVFLNPTLEDNFPTTNLEAMACGTPVITYNTGGSPESIDENTGFVVEKENVDELILKVNNAKINTKRFYALKCERKVEEKYGKRGMVANYLILYNNINR